MLADLNGPMVEETHSTVQLLETDQLAQAAKATMAKKHWRHRMKPRGSFKTSVFITEVPMGCE